jgi:hypothetical protein
MRWLVRLVAFLLFVGVAHAQTPPAAQTARPQVGQPVQQAGDLLRQNRYKDALQKLAAADAVPDKTAYERYVIEGTRAAIYLNSGDYASAIKALQVVLATGILSPADALVRLQTVVQLEYQVKGQSLPTPTAITSKAARPINHANSKRRLIICKTISRMRRKRSAQSSKVTRKPARNRTRTRCSPG